MARLAALVPRPRANLTRYHGVFAPSSSFRRLIVPTSRPRRRKPTSPPEEFTNRQQRGGRLRVIADVTRPDIIQKILEHVARQQAPPECSTISSMAMVH